MELILSLVLLCVAVASGVGLLVWGHATGPAGDAYRPRHAGGDSVGDLIFVAIGFVWIAMTLVIQPMARVLLRGHR